jgi:flagellar biosynthesis/type III secretory pathway M-ring protein FliF/YscJ
MFLGQTLTALLAAGIVSIMISFLLDVANKKEQYLYLYDLRDFIKEKLEQVREALNRHGKQYRAKKIG